MSDIKPIAVGDLVMVVRVCCDKIPTRCELGMIGKVAMLRDSNTYCPDCKTYNHGMHASNIVDGKGMPTTWLKRIDPPALDKHTEQERELCHY